jgi:hypothetical protein
VLRLVVEDRKAVGFGGDLEVSDCPTGSGCGFYVSEAVPAGHMFYGHLLDQVRRTCVEPVLRRLLATRSLRVLPDNLAPLMVASVLGLLAPFLYPRKMRIFTELPTETV